jgi:hypothetical protein
MLKRIGVELMHHAPFTAVGAVAGIIVMVIIYYSNASREISDALFYTLHPIHVVLSGLVTASMYRLYKKNARLWVTVLIGYVGSIGIATLSDIVIPYLGGGVLDIPMEFHVPFIETDKMPYINVAKWIVINSAAVIGIIIAVWRPNTRFPHMGHVLLSTWASLFSFIAFGVADWIPLLPFIFMFLFLSVWLPCCISDIVFPLLWVGGDTGHQHSHH